MRNMTNLKKGDKREPCESQRQVLYERVNERTSTKYHVAIAANKARMQHGIVRYGEWLAIC